ncbi:hypothetical protein BI350_16390 [Sporosarcina ureilytica]|uniref:DUF2512 domain-containing protein n=2 Tax=Sporosarcina ureilytica TaxID=298596 RepID=A0A1D8JKQ8_9BACL|nr:hypothetical protein BI350_16390 [Sporosarcina ureilytica]
MVTVVLWIVLGMFDMSFANILVLSVLLTGISFVGDMVILPRYGNLAATIADFGIAFFVVLLGSAFLFNGQGMGRAAFISAIAIAIGEAIFHKYLQKFLFHEEDPIEDANFNTFNRENLQTEFASEPDIEKPEEDSRPVKEEKRYVPHRPKKRNKKNPY